MGFFDIALRFTLVVASVVADGGGFRDDDHRKNNVEIGLGKGGLVASISEPKVREAEFAGAGKFSGPEHGSLHGSGGSFAHGRLTNNDFGGSFGTQHGVASQFGKVGGHHGHNFAGVGGSSGFKSNFGGGITQLRNVHGAQKFAAGAALNDGRTKGGLGGITRGHNIHGNVNGPRSTFTGSHGAGHAGGPLIIHGKGIKLESKISGHGHSLPSHQGTGYSTPHGGFGASLHGSHDTKLFGGGSGHTIAHGHQTLGDLGSGHQNVHESRGSLGGKLGGFSSNQGRGHQNVHESHGSLGGKFEDFSSDHGRGHQNVHESHGSLGGKFEDFSSDHGRGHQNVHESHGSLGGKFEDFSSDHGSGHQNVHESHGSLGGKLGGFSSDLGRGHQNAHGSNLGDGIFEMLEGQKVAGFDAGAVDLHSNAGQSHHGFSAVAHGGKVNNFGAGIRGGNFGGKSSSGDIGHIPSGNYRNEIKSESFGSIGNLKANVGFGSGHEDFGGDSQGHGHNSHQGFNSGSDFESKDELGGHGAAINGGIGYAAIDHQAGPIASSGEGGFSHQSGYLGKSTSGGLGSGFSGDKLSGGIHGSVSGASHGAIIGGGAIGDGVEKFRGSVHHAGYRGDIDNSGVIGDSLHNFGGADAFSGVHGGKVNSFDQGKNDGGSIGDVYSGPIHGGDLNGGSFGGSLGHPSGKDDLSNVGDFGKSPAQGGHGGASVIGHSSSVAHGGKGNVDSFDSFSNSADQFGKGFGSFGEFASSIGHGRGFGFGGFGQHEIGGGAGSGNFFGYQEDDFLLGKDAGFTGGLGDGFGDTSFHGHGPRVVSYNGPDIHVGDSALGGFGGALSGRGGIHNGDVFNSGFIGSAAGGHGGVLTHGGAVGSSIKTVNGGGLHGYEGAGHLASFGGGIGGDFGDHAGIEGGKFGNPGVSIHAAQHQTFAGGKTGGFGAEVKGDFGDVKSQSGKFSAAVPVHHGGPGGAVDRGHGKGNTVTHEPGNPYGIKGSH